jgi:Tol biopolymer transport system component
VVFQSDATNLVANDTNGATDVFVRDTVGGTTTRVSVANDGTQGNSYSLTTGTPAHLISSNGRYVAFVSNASNLVSGDTNNNLDVFVRDITAGTTIKADVTPLGACQETGATSPSISADGRYVTFVASVGVCSDSWVYDTQTGTSTIVSVDQSGNGGVGVEGGAISDNDRYASFSSANANIVPGDTNNCEPTTRQEISQPRPSPRPTATWPP